MKRLKALLEKLHPGSIGGAGDDRNLQVIAAALMVEVARADNQFTEQEVQTILDLVCNQYDLSSDEAEELLNLATQEADQSRSLFELAREVDLKLNYNEKRQLLSNLWKVAYADQDKHKYEEYIIRKLADLLHLSHRDFVQTRMEFE